MPNVSTLTLPVRPASVAQPDGCETRAHLALRGGTRDAHARLDASFPAGIALHADYARYIAGMRTFVTVFADALQGLAPDFASDLAALRAMQAALERDAAITSVQPRSPTEIAPMELTEANEALGALYVIEGSSIGARVLLRQATSAGWSANHGASFLSLCAGDASRWQRFLLRLNAQPESVHPALLRGAHKAFAAAEQAFIAFADPPRHGAYFA